MRGQVNQAFIFLSAVIVIIAIIFIGMRLLGSVTDSACGAGRAAFSDDLRTLLDAGRVLGSRDSDASLQAPCGATQVCFVDAAWFNATASRGSFGEPGTDPVIITSVRSGSRANVFLVDEEGTHDAGFDERIILRAPADAAPNGASCIPASRGRFTFTTEGYGRSVRIVP